MEFSIVANPIFIPAPFAVNGIKNTIEKIRQSGQDPQDATWDTGWEAITFTPIEAGGKPPKGQDFNGIFNALSQNAVHVQNGNRYKFSQDVIDNYGGYNKDAIIQSDDGSREFISLVDSNTVNPNSGLAGVWSIYAGSGSVPAATSTTAGVTRVINSLNSAEIAAALSAAQGKVLGDFRAKFTSNLAANNGSLYLGLSNTSQVFGIKWGTVLVNGDSNASVTFEEPFSLSCLNAQATLNSVGFDPLADAGCGVVWTRTGLTVRNGTANQLSISWFAVGF